ncbi:TIGR03936 family radical SAM-associated protein [Marinitoga litoralis]|uniref:TIGR03936 family radical SAM-associated protein n=1 Tax=Marinitoga litoralis TaxID=570855 RepID=UPI00195F2B0F|nr:TIGR03936 family radical SAM-associated protein [Marinitoga litoralis]MBM7559461.1 radical SAM-linked protein [Marinitoga litoralis]
MKYLLNFKKYGKSIYISNNDTLEEIERIIRRAKVPIEYTQGFHSKIKLSISQAVPLGYINRALFIVLNTKKEYDFSKFNNFVSEGFKLIRYKSVGENYKLNIKYYKFKVYLSKNLFYLLESQQSNDFFNERFIDYSYEKNQKDIYVIKYKQEYNKIYNIWKLFNEVKEDFFFYPIVEDVIWGD